MITQGIQGFEKKDMKITKVINIEIPLDRALLVFLACTAVHNDVPCTCKNMRIES